MLRRLARRADGATLLIPVAVDALAVLLAADGGRWAAAVALGLALAGGALYVLVLLRFDVRQLVTGAGDQWILGGAAAISALAVATIHRDGVATAMTAALAWVAWGSALVCLVPLCAGELLRPRLSYDVRRWATVFPVGMYAAASFALAASAHASAPRALAQIAVWVAVGVWLAVAAGAVRRLAADGRSTDTLAGNHVHGPRRRRI